MKYYYYVLAQFAKAGAPSFRTEGFMNLIEEARTHFNIRSLVAANPKEITGIQIVDDFTIKISFWSQNELDLQQISRSLRVFSMYLIDENHTLNFSKFISGKRLFKMQASVDESRFTFSSEAKVDKENANEISDQDALIAIVRLLFEENIENRNKITLIKKVLGGSVDASL